MKTAELIIDTPEKNVDLYYATNFRAPDPYIYFKAGERKYMMMTDLEIDRAKKEASVNTVLSLSKYTSKAATTKKSVTKLDAIIVALKERGVGKLLVPESMPFTSADYLRKRGFKVIAGPSPFYPARLCKNGEELKDITSAQRAVFSAMRLAEDMIRKAKIKRGVLYLKGVPLTSEVVRQAIQLYLYESGYVVMEGTIVACGKDTIDPHNFGSGPLRSNQPIIVDIFPKSMKTLFYGDATRTFCKGRAPDKLRRLYNAVKTAQIGAISKIRAGINGQTIHKEILSYFEKQGYKTGEMDGRMQGFFHSTGHGIGLELHEAPLRIGPVDFRLKEGFVSSVEPGLYYKDIGGVRVEDLVYITKRGCNILGFYPKRLEIE